MNLIERRRGMGVETGPVNLFDIGTATRYRSSASGGSGYIINFIAVSSTSNAQTYVFRCRPSTHYRIVKTGGNRLAVGGFKSSTITPESSAIAPNYNRYSGTELVTNGQLEITTHSDENTLIICVKNNTTSYADCSFIGIYEI